MSATNLSSSLENVARTTPDRTFLYSGHRVLTYAEVQSQARRFAALLARLGVGEGDKVALLLPNVPEYFVCYFGALRRGAIPVTPSISSPAAEIAYFLQDSEASLLVFYEPRAAAALEGAASAPTCPHLVAVPVGGNRTPPAAPSLLDLLDGCPESDELCDVGSADPAIILYTSGTTGRPKGAVLSHGNLDFTRRFLASTFWRVGANDVVVAIAPPSHIFGQAVILTACHAGASLTLLERFDPQQLLAAIERDRGTIISGVPALALFLMHSPLVARFDLSSLRRAMIGGSPIPHEVLANLGKRFNIEIVTGYGMTEAVPVTFTANVLESAPNSVGSVVPGTEVRIVDADDRDVPAGTPGEIVVRGPQVFLGYYNRPDATAVAMRNGWFHTGDVAHRDENGFVFLVDRLADIIKRSGYTVYPAEAERVLYTHPAVADVAVIGVPDSMLGEEIKAFVKLKSGVTVSADELIAYCKGQLAAYKYPRLIEFRDSLPLGSSGKVVRRALRAEGAAAPVEPESS
ncbi:MAG: AMP-binding protein [Acidobacteria bacterium]|nr:AMP-binding protein [Acidobacteriota bacterium]